MKKCLGIIKMVSKYFSQISDTKLMWIKTKNKKKIFCTYHKTEKLIFSNVQKQRLCKICNLESRRKSNKKYLQKKQKTSKFTVKF